jgi:heptose I phosphotransferase
MIVSAHAGTRPLPAMISLDEGHLFVHPDFVEILTARGWTTAEAITHATDVDVFRKLADRENAKVSFDTPTGPIVGYLKRHLPGAFVPGQGPGYSEAMSSLWCQQAHVGVATVIAYGHDRMGQEFFLSQELAGWEPADDWLKRNERLGCSMGTVAALLHSLGETIGRLHSAGLFHRDLYWCHLFVRETSPSRFDVRLIDLQRIHRPPNRRFRWQLKDLGQFAFSFPPGWQSTADLRSWFAAYLGKDQLSSFDQLLLEVVRVRARLYAWRESLSGRSS